MNKNFIPYNIMQHLAINSMLQSGKYRILSILGQGGFGITYLAKQKVSIEGGLGKINTEIDVTIKEFFMKDLCNRDESTSAVSVPSIGSTELVEKFRQKFLKEAQNISKLNHPNIINVLDVFEENGTAYYVMEYISGGSLADLIKKNGKLSEKDTIKYATQIANALGYMHERKMNHLDIKPANALLREDGSLVLIDFGLSKNYDSTGEQTTSTPVGVSVGYAPIEQSRMGGVGTFSPATDIYSLGATMFKMITGQTPPEASTILDEGLPELPKNISGRTKNAITVAMQARKKDRPQSIQEFLDILNGKNKKSIETSAKTQTVVSPKKDEDETTQLIDAANDDEGTIIPQKPINLTNELSLCNYYGIKVPDNEKLQSIKEQANMGDANSLFTLGIMYLEGNTVFRNIDKAYELICKAEKSGDIRAKDVLNEWSELVKRDSTYTTQTNIRNNSEKIAKRTIVTNDLSTNKRHSLTRLFLSIIICIIIVLSCVVLCRNSSNGNVNLEPSKSSNTELQFDNNKIARKKFKENALKNALRPEDVKELPSGVIYQILSSGTETFPKKNSIMKVYYEGRLSNGKVFEAVYGNDSPEVVDLANPHLVPGLIEVLKNMSLGSKYNVYVPYKLGFGNKRHGIVEPNTDIEYTIEVVDIK